MRKSKSQSPKQLSDIKVFIERGNSFAVIPSSAGDNVYVVVNDESTSEDFWKRLGEIERQLADGRELK